MSSKSDLLDTSELTLRPFRRSDLDDFAAYWTLPEVSRYMPWTTGDSLDGQEGSDGPHHRP